MSEDAFPALTRRGLLGSAVAGGLVIAGCGGGSSSKSGTVSKPSGPRKRGGTFRFAPVAFANDSTADPQATTGSYAIARALFDPLVTRDHNFQVVPALAEELAPHGKDQSTWTLRLRDGVTFHNGKALSVDDVIYTIQRNLNPKNPGQSAVLLASIDPHGMKKVDDRTLRLHLKYPNSQLPAGLASPDLGIVPVGFDPKKPIGTGPFKQQSYAPTQRWVGVRNENYWRSGQPYLDTLEFIGFQDTTTARTNALLSGQIDGLDRLDPSLLSEIRSRNMHVIISPTGSYQTFEMRCDKGALFEDNRVRQAFKLLVNRPQMVSSAWGGYGAVGNDTGVWHEFDPAMAELPQHAQDIEQAKSLLKAAGKDGMTVQLRTAALATGMVPSTDVLVQNAKAAGVTVKLDVVPGPDYYVSKAYYTSQLKSDTDSSTENMYRLTSYVYLGQGVYNNTGYNNPRVQSLYTQALAATAGKYPELMHELSRIIWEEGPWVCWGRQNIVDTYTPKFTGASVDKTGYGFNGYYWNEISQA